MSRLTYKFDSDVVGQKFGRLTITKYLGVINKNTRVEAICECGVIKDYAYSGFVNGKYPTVSCGCYNKEMFPKVNIKHNLSSHPLYEVWEGMIRRCYDITDGWYKHYGERGVTVCDEWRYSLQTFFDWAINNGWKKGLRLDKDKLAPNKCGFCYCPEYCSFITHRENMWYRTNSMYIKYKGQERCLAEWCFILDISVSVVNYRIRNGWTPEETFETPIGKIKLIEYNGEERSLDDWCKILGFKVPTIYKRLNNGWDIKKAFETVPDKKFSTKKSILN